VKHDKAHEGDAGPIVWGNERNIGPYSNRKIWAQELEVLYLYQMRSTMPEIAMTLESIYAAMQRTAVAGLDCSHHETQRWCRTVDWIKTSFILIDLTGSRNQPLAVYKIYVLGSSCQPQPHKGLNAPTYWV